MEEIQFICILDKNNSIMRNYILLSVLLCSLITVTPAQGQQKFSKRQIHKMVRNMNQSLNGLGHDACIK